MRHLFFFLQTFMLCYFLKILLFSRVVSFSSSSLGTFDTNLSPRYTWSEHALPVTDIHCGHGGMRGHVITSSLDQTCKVHVLRLWKNDLRPLIFNFDELRRFV